MSRKDDLIPDYVGGRKIVVLRGKYKGKTFTVSQSANDWVLVEELGTQVFAKSSVKYVDEKKHGSA